MPSAKTIMGTAIGSIKTIAGTPLSSIKEIGGVTVETYTNTLSLDLAYAPIASANQLALSTNSDFDFEYTDPFSLSAWFKTSRTSWQGIVEKTTPYIGFTDIKGWGIEWYSGRPQFWINNKYQTNGLQAYCTSGAWADDAWHHVVATSAGTGGSLVLSDIAIWVDGVSQSLAGWYGTQSVSDTIVNTADIRIGSAFGGYGSSWDGGLDEISVWNKELSSAEIAAIYNSGAPANLSNHSAASNLVSWWRMGDGDDGAGTSDSSDSSDSDARIYDMSANSHNMTPVNCVSGDIVADVP